MRALRHLFFTSTCLLASSPLLSGESSQTLPKEHQKQQESSKEADDSSFHGNSYNMVPPPRSLRLTFIQRRKLKRIVKKHFKNTEGCQSMSVENNRIEKTTEDYLLFFSEMMLRQLCRTPDESRLFHSRKVHRGVYWDLMKHKTYRGNVSGEGPNTKYLSQLYAALLPLTLNESSGNPKEGRDGTRKSARGTDNHQQDEAGFAQLSPDVFFSDLAPTGSDENPRNFELTRTFQNYLNKINQLIGPEKNRKNIIQFSQLCGINHFKEGFFEHLSNKSKDVSDKRYHPRHNSQELQFMFEKNIPFNGGSHSCLDIANEAGKSAAAGSLLFSYNFLKKDSAGEGISNCFRQLMTFCPAASTEMASYAARLNAAHNGPFNRLDVQPKCQELFEELTDQESYFCSGNEARPQLANATSHDSLSPSPSPTVASSTPSATEKTKETSSPPPSLSELEKRAPREKIIHSLRQEFIHKFSRSFGCPNFEQNMLNYLSKSPMTASAFLYEGEAFQKEFAKTTTERCTSPSTKRVYAPCIPLIQQHSQQLIQAITQKKPHSEITGLLNSIGQDGRNRKYNCRL